MNSRNVRSFVAHSPRCVRRRRNKWGDFAKEGGDWCSANFQSYVCMLVSRCRSQSFARAFSASSEPDYNSYLSAKSKLFQPSPIRMIYPIMAIPGMISLGGGKSYPLPPAAAL